VCRRPAAHYVGGHEVAAGTPLAPSRISLAGPVCSPSDGTASYVSARAQEWNHEQHHLARRRRRHRLGHLELLRPAVSARIRPGPVSQKVEVGR